jgi:hypothetical protein
MIPQFFENIILPAWPKEVSEDNSYQTAPPFSAGSITEFLISIHLQHIHSPPFENIFTAASTS